MLCEITNWFIEATPEIYKKAQADERFPFIVALGRAVNALNFVRSLAKLRSLDDNSPAAKRDRMNSYLFGSAIMYEILKLIRKMNQFFANDTVFQGGLRLMLKDKDAKKIEKNHLDEARNRAIFHFDPIRFKEAIGKHEKAEKFCSGHGTTKGEVHFSYADVLTMEILMGRYVSVEEGLDDFVSVVRATDELTVRFVENAEDLIRSTLGNLGFELYIDKADNPRP